MTTPTFIQAVPWWPERTKNAVNLARVTEGRIIWDENSCALDTFKAVLLAMGSQPGILLEDDVELAPNWRPRIEQVIGEHRTEVIKFFDMPPGQPRSTWMRGDDYYCNQCTYLPAGFAEGCLAWMGSRRPKRWQGNHDWVIRERLRTGGADFWNSVPSLVQHLPFESVIKSGRSKRRQSETFGMGGL